jgi:low temperature requirement protein LtrA
VTAPLILALAYIVVRVVFVALSVHISAGNPQLRAQLHILAIPIALGWLPLLLGTGLGDTAQTLLWAAAFLIDAVGSRLVVGYRSRAIQLRSLSHGTERFGLVLIIALGESLISAGTGAGSAVTRWPVLIAALLGLTNAVCLWWLYFENAAAPAAQAMAKMREPRRGVTGADAYPYTHVLLIAGVIYLAVGIEQVLTHLTHHPPRHPVGAPLGWTSTVALYGGVVLYLTGRALLLRLTVRHIQPAQLAAVGAILLLMPVARHLPALATLGLLTTILVALVCYERLTWEPTAAAR